jgi:hypothetical protein
VIAGKIPNPKLHAPGEFQIPNFKSSKGTRLLQFGTWVLRFVWSLGFEIWRLADGAQKV